MCIFPFVEKVFIAVLSMVSIGFYSISLSFLPLRHDIQTKTREEKILIPDSFHGFS